MVRALAFLSVAAAQHGGTVNDNDLPAFNVGHCTSSGCKDNPNTKLSLDSNWRWTHTEGGSENCYTDNEWNTKEGDVACKAGDTKECGKKCAVGGWPKTQWEAPYGVNISKNGVTWICHGGTIFCECWH